LSSPQGSMGLPACLATSLLLSGDTQHAAYINGFAD
jgi:hypothetical protein